MSNLPSMQDLLEAGVHFGHQVRRWNPKMRPYIFSARDGVHVINLEQTVPMLEAACDFVKKVGEAGGKIIFLGSKKQAKQIVLEHARTAGAMYVVERWIGGLLTNFDQTQKSIRKLKENKAKREAGEFKDRTKKEQLLIDREITKLERFYGGIVDMDKIPDALFVIDVRREENACREAKKKNVPVVAICDTNADLFLVDYVIPGNDDAIKAIDIITRTVADAYREGCAKFLKKSPKEKVELAGERAAKIADGNQIGSKLVNREEPKEGASRVKEDLFSNDRKAEESKVSNGGEEKKKEKDES